MRVLCSFVLCLSVVALPSVRAEGKKPATNAEKIAGKWKGTKGEFTGSTIEFRRGGNMIVNIDVGEATITGYGTYKVDGDKLITVGKQVLGKPKTEMAKIKRLTATELVIEEEKGRLLEFKRVK